VRSYIDRTIDKTYIHRFLENEDNNNFILYLP